MPTIRTSTKQSAEKESFHHVVLNNLRSNPWIALIACGNFSLRNWNKTIVSVNKEGYDCLVI